ncbi:MAG TPA: GNAT family N-acetyltransferase [Actinomycetota bacterium]
MNPKLDVPDSVHAGDRKMTDSISTPRFDLVAATEALLEAELVDRSRLPALLDAEVPPGWPPPLNDDESFRWLLRELRGDATCEEWGGRYVLLRREPDQPITVGFAGFKGPPRDGVVEVGYSIMEPFQRRGYAAEVVEGMTTWVGAIRFAVQRM